MSSQGRNATPGGTSHASLDPTSHPTTSHLLNRVEQQPPLLTAVVVGGQLARHAPLERPRARVLALVLDDVRRVGLPPCRADAKVLHGAHVPPGGAVEVVRREDPAAAERRCWSSDSSPPT